VWVKNKEDLPYIILHFPVVIDVQDGMVGSRLRVSRLGRVACSRSKVRWHPRWA